MHINLLVHKDVVFEDETLYSTGHAYDGCTFWRCTFVYRGPPGAFTNCSFHACIWHIDVLVHDADLWDDFVTTLVPMITKSMGSKPPE